MEFKETLVTKDRTYVFTSNDFQGDIDLEDVLQVDINNIVGDLITFPVIFNRIHIIKTQIDDLLRSSKLELDYLEAERYIHYKRSLVYDEEIVTASGKAADRTKLIHPTETTIKSHITMDEAVRKKKSEHIEVQRQADLIDGFYWSAKSKDQKLNAISAKITPSEHEFEILQESVNGVMIRSFKNVIQ